MSGAQCHARSCPFIDAGALRCVVVRLRGRSQAARAFENSRATLARYRFSRGLELTRWRAMRSAPWSLLACAPSCGHATRAAFGAAVGAALLLLTRGDRNQPVPGPARSRLWLRLAPDVHWRMDGDPQSGACSATAAAIAAACRHAPLGAGDYATVAGGIMISVLLYLSAELLLGRARPRHSHMEQLA